MFQRDVTSAPTPERRVVREEKRNIFTSLSFSCWFCFLKHFMINTVTRTDRDKYLFLLRVCFWNLAAPPPIFPRRQIKTAVTFLPPLQMLKASFIGRLVGRELILLGRSVGRVRGGGRRAAQVCFHGTGIKHQSVEV